MPRKFKTVRGLLHWEYAKLIAGSAIENRTEYAFVNSVYKRLNTGELQVSSILVENKLLVRGSQTCAYCGVEAPLQWEHIIPRALNGPESVDNLVLACPNCNQAKGAKDPYNWYSPDRLDTIPRLVLGKLLKLLYLEYGRHGLLDSETYMKTQEMTRIKLSRIFKKPGPLGSI